MKATTEKPTVWRTYFGTMNGIRLGIDESEAVRDDYAGDIYGLDLAHGLPRTPDDVLTGLPMREDAPLWRPDGFLMPGGADYASGAHHREALDLWMWTATRRTLYADGTPHPQSLFVVWDDQVNGPADAFLSCSTEMVSALCVTSHKTKGERIYTVQHRYRMPVRMLIKGFRCPNCSLSAITAARRPGSRHIRLAQTLDQFPHVVADWDAERNWPVPIEHVSAVRERFVDMRCHKCGRYRINFADSLAGLNGAAQGCGVCVRQPVSRAERVLVELLRSHCAEELTVATQVPAGQWLIDLAVTGVVEGADVKLAIEYDGSHWHRKTLAKDERKTAALARAGWTVIRLRKDPALRGGLPDDPGALNLRTSEASTAHLSVDLLTGLHAHYPSLFAAPTALTVMATAQALDREYSLPL